MIRDAHNVIPISMAMLLHVVLFGSMLVVFDISRTMPITPLAIQATLVTEIPEAAPPPKVVLPEPEPEPEPIVEEPEPEPEPEPDNSEELRRQAEEEKRRLDALVEKERLEKIRQQEEADRKRKEREEAERKKREEAEKERRRIEAEKKREEDIRRQREENERLRRELEAEQRQTELAAEERSFAARNSPEMAAYKFAVSQRIRRNWAVPASAGPETRCTVRVVQLPGGDVVGVNITSCDGDEAVRRSVEAAIKRSSPLPLPSNPDLFDRNLTLNLTLERDD
ncbi:MAG: cell envelope integrity protein TolA [Gammaproteobacteria bacterium]|nr:cell envelope integrity protein TolA [Gammaproteobacteria bacterium]